MEKKVTYRFDSAAEDESALLVSSEPKIGSTTEMAVVQARNGIPEVIQKDRLVYDRQNNIFYVGGSDGTPKRVSDVRTYESLHDRPSKGTEDRLYVLLHEGIFSVWTGSAWKNFATSPVSITSYNGVSTYDSRQDFPLEGEEGQIYLTKDGYGYSYSKEKGYLALFGGRAQGYTREESDSRYALKSEIAAAKTLEELGGITPHDVDDKIQAAKDEADGKYLQAGVFDSRFDAIDAKIDTKEDAGTSYTKAESDAAYAKKEDIPTLSSLGAVTSEQVANTYATKASVNTFSSDIQTLKDKANTLSSYAKTDDVKELIKNSIEQANPDLGIYAIKDDVTKELSAKADADTVALKTDLAPYALKTDIPTLESLGGMTKAEAESAYAKADDVASARKLAMNVDTKLGNEHYTKDEIDQKFADEQKSNQATYVEGTTLLNYLKSADAANTYATKSDLSAKADKSDSYTKAEVDQKISTVQTQGVDLTGYLKEEDAASDTYIADIVKKNTVAEDALVKKDGLLAEVIKQDKAKQEDDLILDYFVNKSDISGIAKTVREKATVQMDAEGGQTISLSEKPSTEDTIAVYVNGVCSEADADYSYDKTLNQVVWNKDSFKLSGKDSVIVEYQVWFKGTEEAPAAADSSTDEDAKKVAIADEDLETIRDCTKRAEAAEAAASAEATKSASSATDSKASAEASAQSAADARDDADVARSIKTVVEAQKKDIDKSVAYLKEEAVAKDIEIMLDATKWSNTKYVIYEERIKKDSIIFIDVREDAEDEAKRAFTDALIEGESQKDGSVTLVAEEDPVLDIPIRMTIV